MSYPVIFLSEAAFLGIAFLDEASASSFFKPHVQEGAVSARFRLAHLSVRTIKFANTDAFLHIYLADCRAKSFEFVCWDINIENIRNKNQLSWVIK